MKTTDVAKTQDPFRQTPLKEQRFVLEAVYLETKEMIVECLWFIRTCFSRYAKKTQPTTFFSRCSLTRVPWHPYDRIRPDSVQPEHTKSEFVTSLQHVAAAMVP